MRFLLPTSTRAALCITAFALSVPSSLTAQAPCPPTTAATLRTAWSAYRADSIAVATARFRAVLAACPAERDARTGLGFALLRAGDSRAAGAEFDRVLAQDSGSVDAWEGRARSNERAGNQVAAISAWRRVLAIDPKRTDARSALDRLSPGWERPERPVERRRAAQLDLTTRVRGDQFEILRGGRWQPFKMRGVNLGLALPGKFPSQVPTDSALYVRWFAQIAEMNANTLRAYTILPPEFYRALRAHNLANPARPLYLVHGVWTELPPRDDFDDPTFNAEYRREIERVVDLLHGAARFAPRPGNAGGNYDADVSPWTIGYIMGREWEPYSVEGFNEKKGAATSYAGRFLRIERATPINVWMVKQCDILTQYEMDTYNAQRPIAYTNWPTTDVMVHRSEITYEQQMRYRGIEYKRDPSLGPAHEEEGVSLDPVLAKPTAALVAGWFASYHVYPYYPDFLLNEPAYNRGRSSLGPSNYFAYLQDLKRNTPGIPLVISEFGIPSSRSPAHLQPQGWNHGGLDERESAVIVGRLAREIEEVGAAGAIAFAWIDEWFKPNWATSDFEVPAERRPNWHNMLSPEQHYGLVAVRPGSATTVPLPGADVARWRALPVVQRGRLLGGRDSTMLRAGSDEGFLYLALELPAYRGRPIPWDSVDLQIGIDTYRRDLGQMVLPFSGLRSGVGFEFLLQLNSPTDAQLQVIPEYNQRMPFRLATGGERMGEPFRFPVRSVARDDAVFDSLYAMTNRPRYLDSTTVIPPLGVNYGRLRYGAVSASTNTDWHYDQASGMIQLRLPWALLNVGDPSSRQVIHDDPAKGATELQRTSIATDGVTFGLTAVGPGFRLLGTMPALDPKGIWQRSAFPVWNWRGWDEPTYHTYLKPAYFELQRLWAR